MERKNLLLLAALIGLLIFIVILFSFNRHLWDTTESIDAERFSHFGTFISSIFGVITIVFLYFTFKQTQKTHQITVENLKEAKKNSIENTFFNLFQAHQKIVSNLHQRITKELKMDFANLDAQFGEVFGYREDKDFFELVYRILHLRYHGKDNLIDRSRIGAFFSSYDWMMGHYFRSLIYFVKWVDDNAQLSETEKRFYAGFLISQLTNDELRLVFYYAISRHENEQKEICKLLHKYSFFDSVKDTLIYQENQEDWKYFLML